MLNQNSPTPNLTQLLQFSPIELSSGIRIADWIQSTSSKSPFDFDLTQIEREPKDSVTKYLNWVCLNAKVFNNFGILLNSSQINNFIEGKSTEIYIIMKQLHDKIRATNKHQPPLISTRSEPPSSHRNKDKMVPSINQLKSTSAISSQKKKKQNILHSKTANEASLAVKPLPSILKVSKSSNKLSKLAQQSNKNTNNNSTKPSVNFPALSLAISPTNSVDRNCEKMSTATDSHSNTYTVTDSNSNPNSRSNDIGNNHIGTITENKTLSLLSPDLNDVIETIKKAEIKPFECGQIKEINDMDQAFERFDDYIIYDGIKLFGANVADFVVEKEKLEQKLNDAMVAYETNNVQYLHHILKQFRTQKIKTCESITDQQSQTAFLKKLQNDLLSLDESLKSQFQDSQKTLYAQLSSIHHQRLKDFAKKISERPIVKNADNKMDKTEQNEQCLLVETSQKATNVNVEKVAVSVEKIEVENELNMTLKEVSSLLEKCWKSEISKQQRQRCDQQQEIGTLKEILSVYQNLSKLVQFQSNTLKTTIVDFEKLCKDYSKVVEEEQANNSAQIQLLSSADRISKCGEESVTAKSANSGRRKRRKGKKSSKKSGCKTPAFSFEYNRGTVSSKNKKTKIGSKKKKKIKKMS